MEQLKARQRFLWLAAGLLAGLCISYLWPHEPAYAIAVDRGSQYAIATCPVSIGDGLEAIFVMDFLTGRLEGRVLNPIARGFTHSYFRNVANDFALAGTKNPQFTIVGGQVPLNNIGTLTMASGVIFVAEMKTGQVVCYGFPYTQVNQPIPPFELIPIDRFQFRAN